MVQKLSRNSDRIVVGITGMMGSGKTTVGHLLEELGALLINADALAHEVLSPGDAAYTRLAALFPEAVGTDQKLDRKKIAGIIFEDETKRKQMEQVVHPYVFQRIAEEMEASEEKVVVLDVPLLFESGIDRFCDVTIVIKADEKEILSRLEEKGISKQEWQKRLKAQMPIEEKIKKGNVVIDNSGPIQQTKQEVEKIWKHLPVSKGAQQNG